MTPSGAVADTRKPFGHALDRLMVAAVDFAGIGIAQTFAHQPAEQRVFLEPDLVRQVERLMGRHGQLMREGARHLARNVLDQGAAKGDVEHLHAAANREDRQVAPRASPMSASSKASRSGLTSPSR